MQLWTRRFVVIALAVAVSGCASLGQIIQPPRFEAAGRQQAQFRFLAPSLQQPLGGLAVRLWARVENPNQFALTLASLTGTLMLQNQRAADVDFPLGVPLPAAGDTVIPLDVRINFSDLPGLGDVAQSALSGRPIGYRLNGTVGVDAGVLGRPTFGPSTLLQGSLTTMR